MYVLMHGDKPVLSMEIDEATGNISKIKEVYEPSRIPVGVLYRKGITDRTQLNEWWESRIIPITRQEYSAKISEMDVHNAKILALKGNALSLSDHFWVRNDGDSLTWDKINLYQNTFSNDIGDFFCMGKKLQDIDFRSPDSTSGGWLKKKWQREGLDTYLLKGSSAPFYQEAVNEYAVSNAYEGIEYQNHLLYSLEKINIKGKDEIFSKCKNMTDINTELVTAYQFYTENKKPNHVSVFDHLVAQAKMHGLDIDYFLRFQIMMNYIVNNKDCHLNNIAFIRNTETLHYEKIAPIFDSGTSLWYDTADKNISGSSVESAKPFAATQQEQMEKYITKDFIDTIDMQKIRKIPEIINQSLLDGGIDEERANRIARATSVRILSLSKEKERIIVDITSEDNIYSTEHDIAEKAPGLNHLDEYVAQYKKEKASCTHATDKTITR